MSKVPSLPARKFIRVLKKFGFVLHRVSGSHHIFIRKSDQLSVSVPAHAGHDLGKGLMLSFLKDAGISLEEFLKLL
ncbi:MAG: type II toxin-antitoxin system HicA family toxin [Patescibacteria group bacterium]|mgnify:FL=1